jgi:hypothetical protein
MLEAAPTSALSSTKFPSGTASRSAAEEQTKPQTALRKITVANHSSVTNQIHAQREQTQMDLRGQRNHRGTRRSLPQQRCSGASQCLDGEVVDGGGGRRGNFQLF